jgi:hypothetical protein
MAQPTSRDIGGEFDSARPAPAPRWIRVVGAVAVAWNLIGLSMFFADAGLFGPAAVSPGVADMPTLVFVAFGISCVTGVAGSVGLALLRRWSRPVLWISAVATVIDWGWVLPFGSGASMPIGVTVLVGAGVLVWLVELARRRGWLV